MTFHRSRSINCVIYLSLVSAIGLSGCGDINTPAQKAIPVRTWTNSIGMRFVFLPRGTFQMGDARFADARPVHQVTVSPFGIGQFEVTNAQFDLFKKRPRPPESLANRQPATGIYWSEAVKFCEWLSQRDERRYRLPTEAEWEYAARGTQSQKDYPWGNESPDGRATFGLQLKTTPVGTYPPNGFGLYDMAGNVREWVWDWYDEKYYANSPPVDPQGPPKGQWKITRGAAFSINDLYCALRAPVPPNLTSVHNGFRIVVEDDKSSRKVNYSKDIGG